MNKKFISFIFILCILCIILCRNVIADDSGSTKTTNYCGRSDLMEAYCKEWPGSSCCSCGGGADYENCYLSENQVVSFPKYCTADNKCVYYNNSNNPYWFGTDVGFYKTSDSDAYCVGWYKYNKADYGSNHIFSMSVITV